MVNQVYRQVVRDEISVERASDTNFDALPNSELIYPLWTSCAIALCLSATIHYRSGILRSQFSVKPQAMALLGPRRHGCHLVHLVCYEQNFISIDRMYPCRDGRLCCRVVGTPTQANSVVYFIVPVPGTHIIVKVILYCIRSLK